MSSARFCHDLVTLPFLGMASFCALWCPTLSMQTAVYLLRRKVASSVNLRIQSTSWQPSWWSASTLPCFLLFFSHPLLWPVWSW